MCIQNHNLILFSTALPKSDAPWTEGPDSREHIVGFGEGSPYFLALALKADTQVSFVITVFWIQEPEALTMYNDKCAI